MSNERPPMLMHERFVAVFPSLVRALDGNVMDAAMLQAINYRLAQVKPDANETRWLKMPLAEIADEIGVSKDQAQRSLTRLRDRSLVVAQGNTGRGNYLMWTIDYEAIRSLGSKDAESHALDSDAESHGSDAESRQKGRGIAFSTSYIELKEVEEVSSALAEPVIVAEIVQEPTARDVAAAYVDEYRDMHGNQPPTQSVKRIARDAKTAIEEGNPVQAVAEAARQAARAGHANLSSALTRVLAVNAQSPFQKRSGASMFLEATQRLSAESLFDMKEIGE